MHVRLDKQNKIVNFYKIDFYNSEELWIEKMSLEDTALFIAEVTKVISEIL